jgi:hypothetical protein
MPAYPFREIRQRVYEARIRGEVVDASAIARTVQSHHPDYSLRDLTDTVIEEVASINGTASWERQLH